MVNLKMKVKVGFLSILFMMLFPQLYGMMRPVNLTCEHLRNPTVVDVMFPRLSWINEPNSDQIRGEYQRAYRICVASSKEKLLKGIADIWDSGKINSSDSYLISYDGPKLQSAKDYWWRVIVWNNKDVVSRWSEPACWSMGLLSLNEWKAQWIGAPWQGEAPRHVIGSKTVNPSFPAPLFRKSFLIKNNIVSAKAFVSGLGYFELYLNGKKVGNDCLVPNFTNYSVRDDLKNASLAIDNKFSDYRVMYLSYDITHLLQKEQNVVGAIVGNGFYDCVCNWVCSFGSPRFLCQIEITYKDGTKDIICTDKTWKVKKSPIIMDGIYDGEVYDANREIKGWATTGCDDSTWAYAALRKSPTGELVAHMAPTDKVTEMLHPISLVKKKDGTYEVDFGKDISGWIRFKNIQGEKGDTLNVKYICESPLGVQQYIFKGAKQESYAPRFTWYVFSKAIISGVRELTPHMIVAEAVNTDVKLSAEFRTSNDLFNKINAIWQRSQLDNMHGCIASDCPHRERSPYTGDGEVSCATVMHNFDAAAFYQKWIRDMRDSQNVESGYVPNSAPWQPGCGGGVAWGAAMNIIPWEYYLQYGDKKVLEDSYFAMKEQVRYMLSWLTKDGTMLSRKTNANSTEPNYWFNLGDWAPAFQIPSDELVHTFYLWRCVDFTAKAAKVLNRIDDCTLYSIIAEKVKKAFNDKFYDTNNKTYGDFGSNVFALVMGVSKERYNDIVSTLYNEIEKKYKGHLNTGIFGTQFLFETLAANGMNDVAYEAMNKRDFPSYGCWIDHGASTTWEQWSGADSHNHPMFGGGLTWFYRILAGINVDENCPGYKHIIIKPILVKKLDHVYYSNVSPYGKIVSEVIQRPHCIDMNIIVPVGSYATVYLPVKDQSSVMESGHALDSASCVKLVNITKDYVIVDILQGNYHFSVNR
jgi:alpha-L-rhamnosidase